MTHIKELKIIPKNGNEMFCGIDNSLLDYWKWAHSDINSNAERGKLAEYIVSKALNTSAPCRIEWDSVDIISSEGIKVEVKSSAYLQTWKQRNFSNIQFDISPKKSWYSDTNTYSEKKLRCADVYVFCLFACKDASIANPLDLSQWEFYIISTKVLNEKVPEQKSIGLNSLISLGAQKVCFDSIRQAVTTA